LVIPNIDDQINQKKEEALKRLKELGEDPSAVKALDENPTEEQEEWLTKRMPDDPFKNLDKEIGKEKRTKAELLLEIANEYCGNKLFIDEYQVPHAAIRVNSHLETLPLNSSRFREWLTRTLYKEKKMLVDSQMLKDIIGVMRAEAKFGDNCKNINLDLRVRQSQSNNKISWYYDLTNEKWEFIEITSEGWNIVDNLIIFRRFNNQLPQVYPSGEYDPDIFDKYMNLLLNVNVENENTKKEYMLLLKCYIISLFIPEIPKVVLMPHGHQGSAKTTLMESIKILVDPSIIKTLSFPRDINELVQQLSHNYVTYYDNVSFLKDWISDQICRAVSGGASSKRVLYTDDDDYIYTLKRCIGINGINLAATKPDLLDRGITIQLRRIEDSNRRKEQQIKEAFQEMRPQLLGYILDILVKVLKFKETTEIELTECPRMADFAEYGEIISRCMGYPENEFLKAYQNNTKIQTEELIESNQIATCLRELMFTKYEAEIEWRGTSSALLNDLETITDGLRIDIRGKYWPKSPNALSRRLNELIPSLREVGIEIEFIRNPDSKRTRIIRIRKLSSKSSKSSKSSDYTNQIHAQTKISDVMDDMDGILQTVEEKRKDF
jgi:hypothetical protein